MDHPNHSIKSHKNKHLKFEERMIIQLRLQDGFTPYKIAKELKRSINTVLNEIRRGTTLQVKQGKCIKMYLADIGESIYKKNRLNSCRTFKYLQCRNFINYVIDKMKHDSWSPDACVGFAINSGIFKDSDVVCTKTLYNYIDLDLLSIKNIDLPLKLRRNNKSTRVKKHKKKLGKSIEERPNHIDSREEFGHWEIDTVIGEKSNNDCVLLTLVERKTRNAIIRKIESRTASSVIKEFKNIQDFFGDKFGEVFKTITSDNGLEFADLSTLENHTDIQVYFTHPYSSFEKRTNERHNGLIRRFIPKEKRISDYSLDQILFIEDWMNTLPRKILNYNSPEQLFDNYLNQIYAI